MDLRRLVTQMIKDDGLGHLVEEGIIDAVHSRLMSGKEATVYVVEREGHLGAAKVYKARDDRTFKKTASYTEGRNQTRNTRDRRAMQNKSSYGRGLIEAGWQDMEFSARRSPATPWAFRATSCFSPTPTPWRRAGQPMWRAAGPAGASS
jgi:serine/threonine-protein kinase RIO1